MKKMKLRWLKDRWETRREAKLAKKHSRPEHQYKLETRLPRVGDYTPRYDISDGVLALFKNIEGLAKEMVSGMELNELNETYMDQYIFTVCEMGIVSGLEDQRTLHKRLILSLQEELRCQRSLFARELDACRAVYEENRKELE